MDAVRERMLYGYGFFQGRVSALPGSPSEIYGFLASRTASLISLPLPFLSFLAIPFYGGSSTTLSLVSFYIAWAALVLTHDPLTLELYGTLVLRLLCFLVPAVGSLAFDCAVPRAIKAIKSRGERQLPGQLGMNRLLKVVGIAVFNVLLAVVLQTMLELFATRILHLRSLVKVSTTVPLPLTIFKQLVYGLILRGISHYAIHRYALHTWNSSLKTWHLRWQHSIPLPFSLVAAYDHPINYLLSSWVPTILPAYLFRWHVLTWHMFLALCSLEELFVFSGYSVLPSTIILAGMARRTDVHFDSVQKGQSPGNFGHLGALDFLLGTQSKEGSTVVDDLQDEAAKRRFHEQVEEAVHAVMKRSQQKDGDQDQNGEEEEEPVEDDDEKPSQKMPEKEFKPSTDGDQAEDAEQSDDAPLPRRSGRGRKKGRG